MGTETAQRYCPNDQKMVLAVRQTPNHVLHLLLSVITFGFWVIIWFVTSVRASYRPYRCQQCGSKTKRWK